MISYLWFLLGCVCSLFQQEKATTIDLTKHLENTLKTRVGTRMKNLAAKVEILKEIRYIKLCVLNIHVCFIFGSAGSKLEP
jgi:hypothetical protein